MATLGRGRYELAGLGAPPRHRVMWELIEPLDDDSIYARFLAEKGEACSTSSV